MTQEVEREIVLGNKQLISLFFVVVALCGVVFALGYMMGSNRSKPATVNLDAAATTGTASGISPTPAPAVPQETEPPRETAPPDTAPTETASTTSPALTSTPTPSAPKLETKPAQDTAAAEESSGATWLQVTALKRSDADSLVKTLREQNFPAVVANSSKPDLFRVLVGPYHQTADVADAKAKLKALGFANAFVQK
jgi:cell division septation protein DedD